MSQGIEQLRINTEKIIARLGEPSTEQEIKAAEIVRQFGKDRVLHVRPPSLFVQSPITDR
jgi:hypothetical protein